MKACRFVQVLFRENGAIDRRFTCKQRSHKGDRQGNRAIVADTPRPPLAEFSVLDLRESGYPRCTPGVLILRPTRLNVGGREFVANFYGSLVRDDTA